MFRCLSKTQTLRLWQKCNLQINDIVTLQYKYKAKILKIDTILYKDIDINDAKNEGFQSINELQNIIKQIYPNTIQESILYRISFILLD